MFIAGIGGLIIGAAGCAVMGPPTSRVGLDAPGAGLTEHVRVSAVTVVAAGGSGARMILAVIRDSARPSESLVILADGRIVRVLIASASPKPVSITVPGMPVPPSAGASPYQRATYRAAVRAWRVERGADWQTVLRGTRARLRRWLDGLPLNRRLSALPPPPPGAGSLGAEAAAAARAAPGLSGPVSAAARRVVVLFVNSLSGTLAPGELNGADVIVVTGRLLAPANASAAQVRLLRAGAIRATIAELQASAIQIARLISAGQDLTARTTIFPGSALFANNSTVLSPHARHVLLPLVAELRGPGTTAVVNGYASTPGNRRHNYRLSCERATAVASFLEFHGIAPSAITVVGHGATGLVAPGPSGRNRRVVVVVAGP